MHSASSACIRLVPFLAEVIDRRQMESESRWARVRPEKPPAGPSGPFYYRHWGSNYGGKPAVGIGHFALWRNRFLEGPPKSRAPKKGASNPKAKQKLLSDRDLPTPTVAGDWDEDQAPCEFETQRRSTPRVEAPGRRPSEPPRPRASRPSTGEKHGRLGGIVPIDTSERPSFGYGIPAVLKPLPPCAIATAAVEMVDIPPEERFQTTYKESFRLIPLTGGFQTPEYFPMRFVPAANRHVKEIALNVLGAHVARKG